jgi:hypothetical protein
MTFDDALKEDEAARLLGVSPASDDDALDEDEAARFLRVSKSFLAKSRMRGDGPVFVKYGGKRIAYIRADLKSWRAARRRTSTGAAAHAPAHAA